MTKKEELAKLDEFIKSLDRNTYLKPWLRAQRQGIEQAMNADVDPSIMTLSMEEFHADRKHMIDEAKESCEKLKALAEERSRQCEANAERIMDEARNALHSALRDLNR